MKKFLGIVFIGLLWCNVGFAEKWTKYTQSKSLTIYYDRQSLNKTDLYSYINLLFDLKESNVTSKGTLRSYKVYRQFNCTDNKFKDLESNFFENKMGKGKPFHSENIGEWKIANSSGTVDGSILKAVCLMK